MGVPEVVEPNLGKFDGRWHLLPGSSIDRIAPSSRHARRRYGLAIRPETSACFPVFPEPQGEALFKLTGS